MLHCSWRPKYTTKFVSVAKCESCHFQHFPTLLLHISPRSHLHRVKLCFIERERKNRQWPPGIYTHDLGRDLLGKCEFKNSTANVSKIALITMTFAARLKRGRIGCFFIAGSSLLFCTQPAHTHTHTLSCTHTLSLFLSTDFPFLLKSNTKHQHSALLLGRDPSY